MRRSVQIPVLILIAGCSSPEEQPPERPARTSLLASAGELRGAAILEQSEGRWQIRQIDRARGGVAEPSRGGGGGRPAPGAPSRDLRARSELSYVSAPTDTLTVALPEGETGAIREEARELVRVNAPLRAGSTDDNADHEAFVGFLAEREEKMKGRAQLLAVGDRRTIRVVDRNGSPVPGAEVAVVHEVGDRVVWRGTTYGDGSFPFYPDLLPEGTAETVLLEVRAGDRFLRHHWNLAGEECLVEIPGLDADLGDVALDVVFLIDTTGSMSDEIERIKQSLLGVTEKLENLDREFDLRYGAVLYRDITDAYVTKTHPFTDDLAAFDTALQTIAAAGGGDTPESLNQGLAVAVDGMEWRDGAAKVVFMIADAPPHMDYENDVLYGQSLEAAVARGIRIHSVAASGLDEAGTFVFRQIAHFTRGKFIFIEYGGDVKTSAEGHGVTGEVAANNLDDILFEQLRDEIAHFGRS